MIEAYMIIIRYKIEFCHYKERFVNFFIFFPLKLRQTDSQCNRHKNVWNQIGLASKPEQNLPTFVLKLKLL